MSTELAIKLPDNVIQKGEDLELHAQTPDEMKLANRSLIQWCDGKIRALRVDFIELDASWKAAERKKWKFTTLKRHAELCKKRIVFYGKLRTALKAGYYIVPNFPVTVFAMRTDKSVPLKMFTTYKQDDQPYVRKDQQSISLEQGKGKYVSPSPIVVVENYGKVTIKDYKQQPKETSEWCAHAESWDEVEFPICMSKPVIMEAVGRAMEIKLFDDFGVLSNASIHRRGCGDPIIIGRLRDPRSSGYNHRFISFIIAWALETRTL